MNKKPTTTHHLFTILEGTWMGEGYGGFPTIASFDYRETLTFIRRDERALAYEQRTEKRFNGQVEWLVSHWENGFMRILENGEVELVNAQSGGRLEVLVGKCNERAGIICIDLASKTILNDPRMVSSARRFELDGDMLRYEMEMQTTKTDGPSEHLKISLGRVK